ncbi:DUF1641 domain-containing protein [Halorhabdus sp. CUG00001]|uniref:DUF1641 domain-containing protein n=1 Tax=Halorhabdus sp. CUG00001 TaxID=2600297 RepID=UPI00131B7678|nr:DUF1641 domain-containing protein [Halorhabdus sp. CUG00001]
MTEDPADRLRTDGGAGHVETEEATENGHGESETDVDLESLVAENPEAVARLLERLDLVNDLLDGADVATSAMDDEMVQSLAGTGTNLGLAANEIATDETVQLGEAVGQNADDLADGVEKIAELQRTGTLDDLLELAELASLASAAMDDEMVMSLASTGTRLGEVADTAADDDVARGLEEVLAALGEATSKDPEQIGTIGLLKATRDPDVQAGLGLVIALARALGQQTRERAEE